MNQDHTDASSSNRDEAAQPTELSLFDLTGLVLRFWRLVVGLPLVLVAATVFVRLLQPRVYEASASFVPMSGDQQGSRLTNLAVQFGVTVPTLGRTGPTPAFYASLLRSRVVLGPVVDMRYNYVVGGDTVAGSLVELIGPRKGSVPARRAATIQRLRNNLDVSTQIETGIVRLVVTARAAGLATSIAERILDQLSAFDLERRRAQAASERIFVEQRLAELDTELRQSEGRHEAFLRRNREFRNSPELSFENDRLAREVAMRQQIYTSFADAFERAKVDESRNTPVLSVIERPEIPPQPRSRGLLLRIILGLVIGLAVAIGVAAAIEFVRITRSRDPEGAAMLSNLLERTRAEIRSFPRTYRRAPHR